MPRKPPPPLQDQAVDVPFPLQGLDITVAFQRQRPLTTPQAMNVRSFDPGTDRARGGARPGLALFASGPGNSIQDLTVFVSERAVAGGIVPAGPGIPGTSTNTITVANPGSQLTTVGGSVNVTNSATQSSAETLHWTAQGLPAGLSISLTTGTITGTTTVVQSCTVVITATGQSTGSSGQATITWIVQTSQTVRTQYIAFVSNGAVNVVNGTGYTAIGYAGGQTALSSTVPVIFSAPLQQQLFFSDGAKYQMFAPWASGGSGQMQAWTPVTGTLPIDSNNNVGTLIESWNGRIVIGGLLNDAANWFQSAQLDPFNWNYSPATQVATQAVAGNDAMPGTLGDLLRAICPYNSSLLVYGYSHSLWLQTGDLGAGGQITNVSQSLGMQWGRPYCVDPFGQMYFVGSDRGVYKYVPGSLPVWISQAISRDLQNLTPYDPQVGQSGVIFRCAWDMYNRGLWVFATPIGGGAAMHFFWEERTNSWWPQQFANPACNPFACVAASLDTADQQALLIGGQDGLIRAFSDTATTDTGAPIASSVVIGPIALNPKLQGVEATLLKSLLPVLADESGAVTWAVYAGPTAESALAAAPIQTGTWQPGRNPATYARAAGLLIYLKLSATGPWALERITGIAASLGKVATRAFYQVPAAAPVPQLGRIIGQENVHLMARRRRVIIKRRIGSAGATFTSV